MHGLVTITVPAASTQLTTLAAARAACGLSDTSQDTVLTQLINAASAVLSNFCGGRIFGLHTRSEQFRRDRHFVAHRHHRHTDAAPLNLSYDAVVSVDSVTEDGTALTVDVDYEADLPAGLLWRLNGDYRRDWFGRVTAIVYDSGWNLPNDDEPNLPSDIQDACNSLIRSAFFGQGSDPNVALDVTEGVGRVQYWNRSTSYMVVDDGMGSILSRYVLRVW